MNWRRDEVIFTTDTPDECRRGQFWKAGEREYRITRVRPIGSSWEVRGRRLRVGLGEAFWGDYD